MNQLFKGKNKVIFFILSIIILGLGMISTGSRQQKVEEKTPPHSTSLEDQTINVTQVIDGDTIEIEGGQKVRYIGIDTPETVDPRRPVACFGKEASEENKKLVEGKAISLVKDISETDKYGRLLRYVYLKLDSGEVLFINDHLIRQGFAHASTFPPDIKFTDQFLEAEKEARESGRGLWSKCL